MCLCVVWMGIAASSSDALHNRPRMKIEYNPAVFNNSDPWHSVQLEVSKKSPLLGSTIGRINWADRFGRSGMQLEVDAYPKLFPGSYLYLNGGFSPSSLFPLFRFGGEFFSSLRGGNELSAGFRYLYFTSSTVMLYTVSYGKYIGNYWISTRTFLTPRESGTSASLHLTGRRYFAVADEYLSATLGIGFAPRESFTANDLERVDSTKVGIGGKRPAGKNILSWSFNLENELLTNNRSRIRFEGGMGYEFDF